MKSDFKISQSIYLVSGGYELDLHNFYDFQEVIYSVVGRHVLLRWKRSEREGVDRSLPASVEISFLNVSRFQFLPRDQEIPFTEDDCLSDAGYWTDEDWCDSVISTEDDPHPDWLNAFAFMSGATILIKAEEARTDIDR